MTDRGPVFIESTDNEALRATEYVQEYLAEWDEGEGEVWLEEVNWLDTGRLVREAKHLGWVAYMDHTTQQPDVAFVHVPGEDDVHIVVHCDNEVCVLADLVNAIGWEDYLRSDPSLQKYFEVNQLIDESKEN